MMKILKTKWAPVLLLVAAYSLIYNPLTKFPYTFCVIIAFILITTYLQDGNLKSLKLHPLGLKELKIIAMCYLLLEISVDFIFDPIIHWLCNDVADYSTFAHIEGAPKLYFIWLLKMWISAAIGEELFFRAFVFAQMERITGKRKIVVVAVSAGMFCLPHLYQGLPGLLSTFVFGIAFALIYLKFKNIWINIIVHGLIDTVFLTLSYLGLLAFYSTN